MTNDVDDLLLEARQSIEHNDQEKDLRATQNGLNETIKELDNLKKMSEEFTMIRNNLLKKLYNQHSVSALKLSAVTGLSRQMVHLIVKEDNNG